MSSSDDRRRLKQQMDTVKTTGNVNVQAEMVGSLMQTVADIVVQIKKEKDLVRDIRNLERQINPNPATPEEEKEAKEAQELLNQAKDVERHIDDKLNMLRRLERVTQGLLSEIKRVI